MVDVELLYAIAPTRDGKVRAEQVSITPQVSGSISELNIKDNQFVNKGDVLLSSIRRRFTLLN